jgi:hypothetical protein
VKWTFEHPGMQYLLVPEEETRVMLFNSTGQMIFNKTTTNPEILIDLPGITSGMYIVKAVSESRQFSRKIVVK